MSDKFDLAEAKRLCNLQWETDLFVIEQKDREDFKRAIDCAVLLPSAIECIEELDTMLSERYEECVGLQDSLENELCKVDEQAERIQVLENALVEAYCIINFNRNAFGDAGWHLLASDTDRDAKMCANAIRELAKEQLHAEGLL